MAGTAGIGADFPHVSLHGRIDFRRLRPGRSGIVKINYISVHLLIPIDGD
jgi:hypothetical protein